MSGSRTMEALQVRYGKVVPVPGGPVLHGFEHGRTGRSAGVPPEVLAECRPDKLGLGASIGHSWETYRWNDEGGGIVGRPVRTAEGLWVLVGRLRGRSEAGEGAVGRMYTEAFYLAAPAATWDRRVTPALASSLRAEPLPEVAPDLAPVTLCAPHVPLPADWLATIRGALEAILSGRPAVVRERESTVAEQMQQLGLLLAAVPAELASRLPFACGAAMVTSEVAFGFGLKVEARAQVTAEEDPATEPGRAYAVWLEGVANGARTVGELASAVDEAFSGIGAPLLPTADEGWAAVARSISAIIVEHGHLDALRRWLEAPPGTEPVLPSRFFALDALLAVAGSASDQRARALERTQGGAWPEAWQQAASRSEPARALGALLGVVRVDDGELPRLLDLVRTEALRGAAALAAAQRVAAVIARAETGAPWADLAAPRPTDGEWLRGLRSDASGRLAWLALRDVVARRGDRLMRAYVIDSKEEPCQAASALADGRDLTPAQIEALVAAAGEPDWPAATALLKRGALSGRVAAGWRLAQALDPSGGLLRDALATSRHDVAMGLAQDLARSGEEPDAAMVELLLDEWPALERAPGITLAKVARRLADAIGQPAAMILLGRPEPCPRAPLRGLGEERVVERATTDRAVAQRLLRAARGDHARAARRLLHAWVPRVDPDRLGDPLASLVARIITNRPHRALPSMTDTDIAAVREAVLLVVDQPAAQEVLDRAKTVEHLELAVGLWTEQRAPRLRPSLLCAALRDAVREPGRQAQWSSIAVRRGWEMAEGWRLLARQHDGPLSDQEDAAIEALCDADLLRLLLASPLLAAPQERLDAVSDTSVQACTESALMVLFRAAAARRAWSLETRVARAAIGSLRRRRMARDELTVALGRGLGAFGAVRGLLERRPEDIVDHLVRWARRHGRKAVEETLWTAWPPS